LEKSRTTAKKWRVAAPGAGTSLSRERVNEGVRNSERADVLDRAPLVRAAFQQPMHYRKVWDILVVAQCLHGIGRRGATRWHQTGERGRDDEQKRYSREDQRVARAFRDPFRGDLAEGDA